MKRVIEGLLQILLYLAAYFASGWLAARILIDFFPEYFNEMGIVILSYLLFIAGVLLFNHRKLGSKGWFTRFSPRQAGHTVSMALGSTLLVTFFLSYLYPDFYANYMPKETQQYFTDLTSFDPLLFLLAVGVLAPVTEELLCRGAIYNTLREKTNPTVAVLLSAAIFAAIHMNLYQGSYALILGLLLGILMVRTGSLWLAILFHIVYNIAGSVLNILDPGLLDILYIRSYAAPILGVILLFTSLKFFISKGR